MVKLTEYEICRKLRIEENRKRLEDLFGNTDMKSMFSDAPAKSTSKKNNSASKKRKSRESESRNAIENSASDYHAPAGEDGENDRPKKAFRRDGETAPESGIIRRSSRLSGIKIDYTAEQDRSARTVAVSTRAKDSMGSNPRYENKRVNNPKQYGHIPGVQVGEWWETREACSTAAVHAPWVAGIAPGPQGAYSVALSGGYDDDVDIGYGFTYTGSGGRDLKGTKEKPKNLRTAPQSSDQTFENNFNRSLQKSSETRKPIRVIRGYKLQSPFAPAEGYRYDGLYTVERAWIEAGNNSKKFKVCKFTFRRLPNQPPLERREDVEERHGDDENEPVNAENQVDEDATAYDEDRVDDYDEDIDADGSEDVEEFGQKLSGDV